MQRDIAELSVSRFRSDREVRTLRQECFLAGSRAPVVAAFRREFLTLLPPNLQQTELVTPPPLQVGSRLIATPMFLTRPRVAVQIIALNDDEVAYAYLEGGPLLGRNVIRFSDDLDGTSATVTLHYQMSGLLPAIGWSLLGGERFHRRLIAEGFETLARRMADRSEVSHA